MILVSPPQSTPLSTLKPLKSKNPCNLHRPNKPNHNENEKASMAKEDTLTCVLLHLLLFVPSKARDPIKLRVRSR